MFATLYHVSKNHGLSSFDYLMSGDAKAAQTALATQGLYIAAGTLGCACYVLESQVTATTASTMLYCYRSQIYFFTKGLLVMLFIFWICNSCRQKIDLMFEDQSSALVYHYLICRQLVRTPKNLNLLRTLRLIPCALVWASVSQIQSGISF